MLSVENTHYGRAKSIMMAKGLDHLEDWNPALYDIDESDSSTEGSTEEDPLAIKTAMSDPSTNGTYLSIEQNGQENANNHGRRPPPRRHSNAFGAWKSVYGLNRPHVPPRRHSVFHIDSTRDMIAAGLS